MNLPGTKSRIAWHLLERSVLLGLIAQAAIALLAFALGWISFLLYLVAVVAELLTVSVLTGLRYPARGWKRWTDALKILALCLFLMVFIVLIYASARFQGVGIADEFWNALGLEPRAITIAFGLLAFHVGALWMRAQRSADPRLTWTGEATRDAAVSLIALFFGIFASIGALFLAAGAKRLLGPHGVDFAFGAVFVLVRFGMACVAATMTERELRSIAGNPYAD